MPAFGTRSRRKPPSVRCCSATLDHGGGIWPFIITEPAMICGGCVARILNLWKIRSTALWRQCWTLVKVTASHASSEVEMIKVAVYLLLYTLFICIYLIFYYKLSYCRIALSYYISLSCVQTHSRTSACCHRLRDLKFRVQLNVYILCVFCHHKHQLALFENYHHFNLMKT